MKAMDFLKEEKAQTSIEVLVLIAGAIVVATIVGVLLKRAAAVAAEEAGKAAGTAANP